MEIWQIVAIALGSAFAVLFIACIACTAIRKNHDNKRMEAIKKMYADPKLAKMEYDFSVSDEQTEKLLARAMKNGGQISAFNNAQQLATLGSSDMENLEEITGNYKP